MCAFETVGLSATAIIHPLPLSGVMFDGEQPVVLCSIDAGEANTQGLLRHRGLLFAIVGVWLLLSTAWLALRVAALAAKPVVNASIVGLVGGRTRRSNAWSWSTESRWRRS